ncbi:carboxypeptidase G2 [Rodentibacter pneumotropicus]|uniref:Carboxypeptidase G2 n=1 Tax=Rodentibacter pneumotropicus TaxID=758 RepID=A0A3S4U8F2_9PAST|nr:carboxypeptidase G2 [Rodentibacter pneumotropicus]
MLENPLVEGVTSTKTLINKESPMIDEKYLPLIKKVFNEVGEKLAIPIKWVDAGGLSDGNIAASTGCPTIDGLGPIGGNMHAKTEYLEINSVIPKCNLVVGVINALMSHPA